MHWQQISLQKTNVKENYKSPGALRQFSVGLLAKYLYLASSYDLSTHVAAADNVVVGGQMNRERWGTRKMLLLECQGNSKMESVFFAFINFVFILFYLHLQISQHINSGISGHINLTGRARNLRIFQLGMDYNMGFWPQILSVYSQFL